MIASSGGAALIGLLFIVALYFLPTITAASRHVPNQGSVFVINLFLGWTFIGWVIALAMAARSRRPASPRLASRSLLTSACNRGALRAPATIRGA